jgi:adenine-specific DNA-methyltransferase
MSVELEKDIKNLGQVFTPDNYALKVLSLRQNFGSILEPSCGNGAFTKFLKNENNLVAVEIDERWCPEYALNMDFFDFYLESKNNDVSFDTVVANPPFLRFKNVPEDTKQKILNLFPNVNKKINLYALFIYCCIDLLNDGGELLFINPYDFVFNTSCKEQNKTLYERGTITHINQFFDTKVFDGISQDICIWRYEKDNFTRKTNLNNQIVPFGIDDGILTFFDKGNKILLGDHFQVKVGGVSGKDAIFEHPDGNEQFVCSYTKTTGELKTFFYNVVSDYLKEHKNELITRKIKRFDESNWWKWGREHYKSDKHRIYVNCKTRQKDPFFVHECKNYDGSILALIPKVEISQEELIQIAKKLNQVDWKELGFKQGGRYIFTQRTLTKVYLPKEIFNAPLTDDD